jgi:hypothetical protein
MKRKLDRYDYILLFFLALMGVVLCGVYFWYPRETAKQVVITVNGEVYGTYDPGMDQTIDIRLQGKVINVVTILDHQVFMTQADCPDHLCMKQGKISRDKETIVCLPNEVVVTMEGGEASEFDGMTN